MAAARAEATEATAWRLFRRLGYHRKQQQIQALDKTMELLRVFQPALVPGLLQTPEYARAVFARYDLGEDQLSRAVAGRLDRQSVLYDTTKDLRFVISEAALRWRIISAPMLACQLDRIISVSRLPNVDIRVVTLVGPHRDVASHAFAIRDDRLVTVETVHAELVVTDPRDVALYVSKFDGFSAIAVSNDVMRSMIEALRNECLREQESS